MNIINVLLGEKGPGSAAQDIIEVSPQEVKEKREKERRKKLTALLEKVERCSVSQYFKTVAIKLF